MAGGELQGWYRDPFGRHQDRYISGGRPTKLVRDGQVESYDEPPSSVPEMPAGDPDFASGGRDFASGSYAAPGGYAAPRQGYAGEDRYLPDRAAWSPWRWYGRAIIVVVVIAASAILAVIAFGGSRPPAWASSLGAGVIVDAPAAASPGHGSPGAAVSGFLGDIEAKNYAAAVCDYFEPSMLAYAGCPRLPALGTVPRSSLLSITNLALGYTAIEGGRALVGITGTVCPDATAPAASCHTNNDPAALFSSGKPFSTLWTQAVDNSGNTYSLIPCVEEGGSWYIYTSSS